MKLGETTWAVVHEDGTVAGDSECHMVGFHDRAFAEAMKGNALCCSTGGYATDVRVVAVKLVEVDDEEPCDFGVGPDGTTDQEMTSPGDWD